MPCTRATRGPLPGSDPIQALLGIVFAFGKASLGGIVSIGCRSQQMRNSPPNRHKRARKRSRIRLLAESKKSPASGFESCAIPLKTPLQVSLIGFGVYLMCGLNVLGKRSQNLSGDVFYDRTDAGPVEVNPMPIACNPGLILARDELIGDGQSDCHRDESHPPGVSVGFRLAQTCSKLSSESAVVSSTTPSFFG